MHFISNSHPITHIHCYLLNPLFPFRKIQTFRIGVRKNIHEKGHYRLFFGSSFKLKNLLVFLLNQIFFNFVLSFFYPILIAFLGNVNRSLSHNIGFRRNVFGRIIINCLFS